MKNQNNQLLKLWFLQATETLCHLSVTDIKKRFCNIWFFCINEACVNCGKENATTLTWLKTGKDRPINCWQMGWMLCPMLQVAQKTLWDFNFWPILTIFSSIGQKIVLKCWKDLLWYSTTLETYRDSTYALIAKQGQHQNGLFSFNKNLQNKVGY
jgi:hypothetical protein